MAMPKLTCTTPHGVFERWTGHFYTHVVVRTVTGNGHFRNTWHKSQQSAESAARTAIDGTTVQGIFPVDVKEGK